MLTLAVKCILLLSGVFTLNREVSAVLPVAAVLCALTLTSLNQYFHSKTFTAAGSLSFFAVSVFLPVLRPFLSLFCFDLLAAGQRMTAVFAVVPLVLYIPSGEAFEMAVVLLLIALAVFMQTVCEKMDRLTDENKRIRDNGVELNRLLTEKNKYILENQDYEIHLATLKERNRIAREIHDNVGHILSRSILQAGALSAVNKDTHLAEHIAGLKETLSLAMDTVRDSVHGLRDEAVDLCESIRTMTEHLPYAIQFDYDITNDIPNNIKYCFLAVLKEALTNIARHSDATRIHIVVREHPAIVQLLIHDNGTQKPSSGGDGMGLSNMEERVLALNGRFSAEYRDGFRVFIAIFKQEDAVDEHHNC